MRFAGGSHQLPPQMIIGHTDGGVHDRKIRAAVAVQGHNRLVQPVMKDRFFPGPAAPGVVPGRKEPHHVFHAAGEPAIGMGLEHRQGDQHMGKCRLGQPHVGKRPAGLIRYTDQRRLG